MSLPTKMYDNLLVSKVTKLIYSNISRALQLISTSLSLDTVLDTKITGGASYNSTVQSARVAIVSFIMENQVLHVNGTEFRTVQKTPRVRRYSLSLISVKDMHMPRLATEGRSIDSPSLLILFIDTMYYVNGSNGCRLVYILTHMQNQS